MPEIKQSADTMFLWVFLNHCSFIRQLPSTICASASSFLSALDIQERKLCIVTERRVASYYLEEVKSILEGRCAKVEVYIFLSNTCVIRK